MDFLRRELAPISRQGWEEIDAIARQTLSTNLSGRRIVDIDGPHGIARACVPLGRLTVPKKQPGKVNFGIHQTMPLVETRVDFTLQTWELDNLERGAKDIDLAPVAEACRESAAFEEAAIFDGFEAGGMAGLHQAVKGKELRLPLEVNAVVDAVAEARGRLLAEGVEGPASLVVSPELCKFLSHGTQGGTLRGIIERHMGVPVIYSAAVKDALMVAGRGGDLELTVGQDFAVGYHSHTASEIRLFVVESFAFRVIAPEALVGFKLV
ncbi:family 1 encapsulin nanocompartment shell protein [Oleispirillum naphthae]|uniref:family 1 encapsulin nanocompartment shell protein n=1 Tax=Oleispirillum naphthae TaxID=2838853 RepID=UPI003082255C